jgi:hypothetical protein
LAVDTIDPQYADLPIAEEHPALTAVKILQDYLGEPFSAIVSGELGGASVAEAFYPAALLGLPVVDADPAGRAVPELQHSLFTVHDVPITPQAVTNRFGDAALITRVANDSRAEALLRALSLASRNLVWAADHPVRAQLLKDTIIPGAISLAMHVGRAAREAAAGATAGTTDLAQAIARSAGGSVLFRGAIESSSWEDEGGFTLGEFTIAGEGAWAGSDYRIWYKNENLVAWRDGEPQITCPDLICVIDDDAKAPLTNPNQRLGMCVSVVGVPAHEMWRSEKGIAIFGPRSLGWDIDYRPLEVASQR